VDGGVTFISRSLPSTTNFGVLTVLGESGGLNSVIWDGAQFVAVGSISGSPNTQGVVGTSADGVTWTWANLADSFKAVGIAFNGTTYVAIDWRAFVAGQKSRIYSATSPLGPWNLRFTSATEIEYAWIGTNGSGFIAFSTQHPVNAYSADGLTWTENASGILISQERRQVLWDIQSNQWIVAGELANGHLGIATSPIGAAWTTRLDLGVAPGSGQTQSVIRGAGGNLFAWVGTPTGQPYTSTDNGATWSVVGPIPAPDVGTNFVWTGALFVTLGDAGTPTFDSAIFTSPDLLTFTKRDDESVEGILSLHLFTPPAPPPPSGDLIGFTFNEEQQVTAWHRHPMVGSPESIACIPAPAKNQDDLWLIVNRTINSVTRRYVEYLGPHFLTGGNLATDAFYSDSGSTYNGASTQTITGLGYLEGMTVKVLTDGARHPDCTVTGGTIKLQWPAKIVQVGLPQTCRLTTMPLEAGGALGTSQGKVKRITDITFRFLNTLGGKAGREDPDKELSDPPETVMDDLEFRDPDDPMDQALTVYNGLWPEETYAFNWPGGYEVEGRLTYINDEPFPVTIVGIYPNLDSED